MNQPEGLRYGADYIKLQLKHAWDEDLTEENAPLIYGEMVRQLVRRGALDASLGTEQEWRKEWETQRPMLRPIEILDEQRQEQIKWAYQEAKEHVFNKEDQVRHQYAQARGLSVAELAQAYERIDENGQVVRKNSPKHVAYRFNPKRIKLGEETLPFADRKIPINELEQSLNDWSVAYGLSPVNNPRELVEKSIDHRDKVEREERTAIYRDIGSYFTVIDSEGHVDVPRLTQDYALAPNEVPLAKLSVKETVEWFNQLAEWEDVPALKDPMGYLIAEDNLQSKIIDTYDKLYGEMGDMIDSGQRRGGRYAMDAVRRDARKKAHADIRPYLPEGVKWGDLRFRRMEEDQQRYLEEMVQARVNLTYLKSISRSVERQRLDEARNAVALSAERFAKSLDPDRQKPQDALSKTTLLENADNNRVGFVQFAQQLSEPEHLTKNLWEEHARASFTTSDPDFGRFLVSNQDYLEENGFTLTKSSGEIHVTWTSERMDELWLKQTEKLVAEEGEKQIEEDVFATLQDSTPNGPSL